MGLKAAEVLSSFVSNSAVSMKIKFNEMAQVIQETFRRQISESKINPFAYFCNV